MTAKVVRRLFVWLVTAAGVGCGGADAPGDDPPPVCEISRARAELAPPPGARPGEPYRWLARSWRSPLGLTVRTYGLAVDGAPIDGHHQIEIYDDRGALVHRAGSGDTVLAELRARGATGWAAWRHPVAARGAQGERSDPLAHTTETATWHYAHGELIAAIATDRVDLRGEAPVGELTLRDATTGAVLTRSSTIYQLTDPEYLVYAKDDGRPTSPLGDTFPHATGVPDGKVPPWISQQPRRQSTAVDASTDPWLPAAAHQTRGNNVLAFYDSLLDRDGKLVDLFDAIGKPTPAYGPLPDAIGHDFLATATGGRFAFAYDPAATATAAEYVQTGRAGTVMPLPDRTDVALNAKIVAAFYATNWLHDYFYRAGFNEVAGNAQQSNLGRGGVACDPLIIHAGMFTTFTQSTADGESPVINLGVSSETTSRRDTTLDFTIAAHEWGHYLIGRLAGTPGGSGALATQQGLALHEGIADFVSLLVNLDAGDDVHGAFAIGSYSNLDYIETRPTLPPVEARADALYYGIRRYPYSLDFHKNPLTFRHLAVPPPAELPYFNWQGRGSMLSEPHTTGEVFAQALFHCFGNIVLAHPTLDFGELRARMAQYLVAGLAAFPDHPSLLDARDAFLAVIRLANRADDYAACRAGFAARGMGADALGPDRDFGGSSLLPYDPAQVQESFLDQDRALRLVASGFTPTAGGSAGDGTLRVDLRNTGLVELATSALTVAPAVAAAVTFATGATANLGALAAEHQLATMFAVTVDACQLPPHPTQAGARLLDYTVTASAPGPDPVSHQATFHVAVAPPAAGCP